MAPKASDFDRIRGSADIPLNSQGRQQVAQLGENFKKNGPLDIVISSGLQRTKDTGDAVANGAPHLQTDHLKDMDYGVLTGMKSKDAIPLINKHITQLPDVPVPGGETYNAYKGRLTNMLKLAQQASRAYPDARIGLVVNRRSIKTAEAWLANGKMDNIFDDKITTDKDEQLQPGDVFKITGKKEGSYGIAKVDSTKKMDPGVYLIRHGLTDWNGESHVPTNKEDT